VFYESTLVGRLNERDDGMSFEYTREWLEGAAGFAISTSLPRIAALDARKAQFFFANLLPEANVRALLCRRLRISVDNDFALLEAIGGECAGALTLLPDGQTPSETEHDYELLPEARLKDLADGQSPLPVVDHDERVRLSLAGAQDKLPVFVDGDRLFLPRGNSPSTHILKFPNPSYKHLPANEAWVSALARKLELPTVRTSWRRVGSEGLLLVERYDRRRDGDTVTRLHQEDFCQAFGLPSFKKYEGEGGPTFPRCVEHVRKTAIEPLRDTQSLLRWHAFNLVAGNADGHAKNLSMLWNNGWQLAPFYDLVCTRAFDNLDRRLAMTFGPEGDPDRVRRKQIEEWASSVDLRAASLVATVVALARKTQEVLGDIATEAEVQDSPAVAGIAHLVGKQAKRLLRELGPGG